MKKSKKIVSILLTVMLTATCFSQVFAAAPKDDYLFIPVKTGEAAMNLLTNTTNNGSSGNAVITKNVSDNEVSLQFPEGVLNDTVIERTRTEVDVDESSLANYPIRYYSFDMAVDNFMDLVISKDPYGINSGNWDNRPLSLFMGDTGFISSTIHSRTFKYENTDAANGYKGAITGDWWYGVGFTSNIAVNEYHKIMIVCDSTLSNNDGMEVMIYVDGVKRGEYTGVKSDNLETYRTNLSFTHYATSTDAETLKLKNFEVGYCLESTPATVTDGDISTGNTMWWFPEGGDLSYIKFEIPTGDTGYRIRDLGSHVTYSWFGSENWGCLKNDWNDSILDYVINNKGVSYDAAVSWGDAAVWKDTESVTLTCVLDRKNKKLKIFTDTGCSATAYYTGSIDEIMYLHRPYGDNTVPVPTKVEQGLLTAAGTKITDASGNSISTFTQEGEIHFSSSGITNANEDVNLFCAWYGADNKLMSINVFNAKSNATGVYQVNPNFNITAPSGATKLKVFTLTSGFMPIEETVTLASN